jgi:hypothetical protein
MTQQRAAARSESDSKRFLRCETTDSREIDNREVLSCAASGTATKRNPGAPASAAGPRARRRRLGVDEGDVEAVAAVKEPGELGRRGDVALRREREEHQVRPPRHGRALAP